MIDAYLGIGSNLGNTKENLMEGIRLLQNHGQIKAIKVSSLYKTEPIGYKEQEWFLNAVLWIKTELSPLELLEYCQSIESKLKRRRVIKWGPRTIDIDILLYGNLNLNGEILTIPHPRMTERAFVMIPLAEISPQLVIGEKSIKELTLDLKGQGIVKLDSNLTGMLNDFND
ncbi:MAG: 2-amino-4-hydroxy-6-hydroxymethyldihydropteridine diphosphokinase [Bacillota bacterium]